MISADAVVRYLYTSESGRSLRSAANAAGFLEDFADEQGERCAVALERAGVESLEQLAELVAKRKTSLAPYFQRIATKTGKTLASSPFLLELALILESPDRYPPDYLEQLGWSAEIATSVIDIARTS
jgi:hypothetical protein